MTPNPTATETIVTTLSLATSTLARTGSMRCETAGSPTQPRAREATVIPTWQTERFESRSRRVSRTRPARAIPSCSSCTMRDSRTRTRANSAATKKPFRATRTKAASRFSQVKTASSKCVSCPQSGCAGLIEAGSDRSLPSRYARIISQAPPSTKPAGPRGPGRARGRAPSVVSGASLRQALGLVLAQEALEEAAGSLLVVEDGYEHVVGDGVQLFRLPDDAGVVLDRAVLRVDNALYDVHDVDLVLGRLQGHLGGLEVGRARHHTVELLDSGCDLLGVPELLLDVLLDVLLDLLGSDAVGVYGIGDVVHDRLQLHEVRGL